MNKKREARTQIDDDTTNPKCSFIATIAALQAQASYALPSLYKRYSADSMTLRVNIPEQLFGFSRSRNGFKQDTKLAYKWAKKAHTAGSVIGTAQFGCLLFTGIGVAKNEVEGIAYTFVAAAQGSDCAAYNLGRAFCYGACGLSVDTAQGIHWLQKCLSDACPHKHLSESHLEDARAMLQQLTNAA